MHVVLVEPEIPQNTGNIARTCAATGTPLHLVGPLGFSLSDRYLRRAGLDYWPHVDLHVYGSLEELGKAFPNHRFYLFTTKGHQLYHQVRYRPGDLLIFGSETRGLPQDLLERCPEACVRVPMRDQVRSLNLSNTVALVLYEALRQMDFSGLV